PLHALDELFSGNFKIEDLAEEISDCVVVMAVDKRSILLEVSEAPASRPNDFAVVIERFVAGDIINQSLRAIDDADLGMNCADKFVHDFFAAFATSRHALACFDFAGSFLNSSHDGSGSPLKATPPTALQ